VRLRLVDGRRAAMWGEWATRGSLAMAEMDRVVWGGEDLLRRSSKGAFATRTHPQRPRGHVLCARDGWLDSAHKAEAAQPTRSDGGTTSTVAVATVMTADGSCGGGLRRVAPLRATKDAGTRRARDGRGAPWGALCLFATVGRLTCGQSALEVSAS
jgi:hypothetical protein